MQKVLNFVFGLMLMSITAAQAVTGQQDAWKRATQFMQDHKQSLVCYAAGIATPFLFRFGAQRMAQVVSTRVAQVAKNTGKKAVRFGAGVGFAGFAAVGAASLWTNKPPLQAVEICKHNGLAWFKQTFPGFVPPKK